jgi:ornithine cyclodeaminase/alanine dehydrogenase-like protein (mu-crystallin family)
MLLLREQDILDLLPMHECIRLIKDAFAALAARQAQNHARRRLALPTGSVLHSLAGAYGSYFGAKIYSTHVRHGAHFLVLLYDAATAKPLALIEANHLGQIRTGAATGVATDLLAPFQVRIAGVIGTGFQARTQVEALRAVRSFDEIRVWGRNPDRRNAFAASLGGNVRAVDTAETAIRGAGVIVTATSSKDPVLSSDWVKDGAHINAIGSNQPQRRELPPELVQRAGLIAVDALDQARIESGDLLLTWDLDQWPSHPIVEMQQVASGKHRRASDSQITIFKSNGLGVQDVTAAGWVYERAIEQGKGSQLDILA